MAFQFAVPGVEEDPLKRTSATGTPLQSAPPPPTFVNTYTNNPEGSAGTVVGTPGGAPATNADWNAAAGVNPNVPSGAPTTANPTVPGSWNPPVPAPAPYNPAGYIGDPGFYDPAQGNAGNVGYHPPGSGGFDSTAYNPGPDGMGAAGVKPVIPLGSPLPTNAPQIPPPAPKPPGSPDLPIPASRAPTSIPGMDMNMERRVTDAPQVQAAQAAGVSVLPAPTVTTTGPEFAGRTTAERIGPSANSLQDAASRSYQDVLSGKTPSVAELQQRAAFDRLAKEQMSIAAGARGRSVAAASRQASNKMADIGVSQAGAAAELRAKETEAARAGAGALGTSARGQDIDVSRTNAENTLKASMASDERLQGVMSEYSKLKLAADQGNQDAATKLTTVRANIESEINRFNAQQLQGASADNAANFLKGVGLDDQYVNAVRDQWLKLQELGQTERLELLKQQVLLQIEKVRKDDPSWLDRLVPMVAGGLAGFAVGGPMGAAVGATAGAAGLPIPGVKGTP